MGPQVKILLPSRVSQSSLLIPSSCKNPWLFSALCFFTEIKAPPESFPWKAPVGFWLKHILAVGGTAASSHYRGLLSNHSCFLLSFPTLFFCKRHTWEMYSIVIDTIVVHIRLGWPILCQYDLLLSGILIREIHIPFMFQTWRPANWALVGCRFLGRYRKGHNAGGENLGESIVLP